MKNASQWKPSDLIAMADGRRFIISDSHIAARVTSLAPWGLPAIGGYRKGKRGSPYAAQHYSGDVVKLAKAFHGMARKSDAEAWPMADGMGYELFIHRANYDDKAWLWTNEHGDTLAFNAKFFDDLSVLAGLVAEREYTFTCEGSSKPMFVWDHQHGRDVWLGAIMPVRIEGGLVQVAELPNGTEGRGKAA
ncbi:MAG: hypothetical protein JWO62_1661 [Acidimicrobiaceae bacterium]|nr:hypothetical protein [Acidimicrobiaceae bacterium]